MKLRFALLVSSVLCFASLAFGQSQPASTSIRTSSLTAACPRPQAGKIAWFDTCIYLPIGDGVKPGHPLSVPDPQYAESARRAKITGQVVLAVAINATGVVDIVRVMEPLEPGLDQNAVEAVKQWRFTPGTKDGKPVAVQIDVVVGYRLN
jgi:protein TonB